MSTVNNEASDLGSKEEIITEDKNNKNTTTTTLKNKRKRKKQKTFSEPNPLKNKTSDTSNINSNITTTTATTLTQSTPMKRKIRPGSPTSSDSPENNKDIHVVIEEKMIETVVEIIKEEIATGLLDDTVQGWLDNIVEIYLEDLKEKGKENETNWKTITNLLFQQQKKDEKKIAQMETELNILKKELEQMKQQTTDIENLKKTQQQQATEIKNLKNTQQQLAKEKESEEKEKEKLQDQVKKLEDQNTQQATEINILKQAIASSNNKINSSQPKPIPGSWSSHVKPSYTAKPVPQSPPLPPPPPPPQQAAHQQKSTIPKQQNMNQRKKIVCRHEYTGGCRNPNCRFEHVKDQLRRYPQLWFPPPPCPNVMKGITCPFGSACRLSHVVWRKPAFPKKMTQLCHT